MEDHEILELYFARNEDAIVQTQRKYGGPLEALCRRITEDALDAQECVSDTYLQAWQRIPPHRPDYFYGFLARIARHISLNRCQMRHARKRSAIVVELSDELQQCLVGMPDAVDWDNEALKASLNRFVRGLEPQSQYIFVRRYFLAESLGEIARRTGRSENDLASLLFRIRRKLKNHLQKEGIPL